MRLGMFMQPVHDPKRDQTQVIDEDREAIILADKLGFEEVWVGEHAAATVEPITAPLVFLLIRVTIMFLQKEVRCFIWLWKRLVL